MEEKNLKLLSHFSDKYKGVAFNTILFYMRKGENHADEIVDLIQRKLEIQKRWGLEGTNAEWDKYFKTVDFDTQMKEFYEAMEVAETWEKKTPEEREKIKSERDEYYKNLNMKNSMKGKPATEKQIAFIEKYNEQYGKTKGYKDVPSDRYDCSEIIDEIKNQ